MPGVDQPIVDSFPEYADLASDPQRRRTTVGHALTITSGPKWDEDRPYTDSLNSEIAMDRAAGSYRYVLDRPFVAEPGEQWNYNGGTATPLARMIARGTATLLTIYAEQRLFAPLGIEDFEWVKGYYGESVAASAFACARAIWRRWASSCSGVGAGIVPRSFRPRAWALPTDTVIPAVRSP